MARYASLYKGNSRLNIIKDDPDLFLLHAYYHKYINKLFILYKKYSDGKKILDVIDNPYVPIYLSKTNLKETQESIPISSAHCYVVPFKEKATAYMIYKILDDEEKVIDCNENAEGKAHNCNEEACGETCIWSRLDNAMTKILSETSLEDFIKNGKKI